MGLRIAVFGSGAVLMALEILAFRLTAKSFGGSLRETTAVIAVFLASMSVGYFLGGKAGDRWPRARTLILPMIGAGLLILLVPGLDRTVPERVAMSSLPLGLHAILSSLALFMLPTILMASISPIAIRLLVCGVENTGKTAGNISALSTVGSIAGTLLTGFWLIDVFQSYTRLTYALGVTMFILAAVAAIGARLKQGAALGVALVFVTAGAACAQSGVVVERDSAYHHIVVRDEGEKRVLYFDNAPQSEMDRDDPTAGGFEYTDFFHAPLLFKPDVKDVLFIGLGGGSAPKRFLRDYPNAQMDAVDVDRAVIEIAQKHFAVKPGPRLRLIEQDGRAYVKRAIGQKKLYDLVVLDAYTHTRYGSSIPSHLTTREFFGEVDKILRPGGVVAYNVTGNVEGWGRGITRALLRTMTTRFTSPYLFEAESSQNTVIVAFKGSRFSLDGEALAARAKQMVAQGKVKLPNFVRRAGRGKAAPAVKDGTLLTDDYAPVDRLMRD